MDKPGHQRRLEAFREMTGQTDEVDRATEEEVHHIREEFRAAIHSLKAVALSIGADVANADAGQVRRYRDAAQTLRLASHSAYQRGIITHEQYGLLYTRCSEIADMCDASLVRPT